MFVPLPDESHQKIIKRRRPASGQVTKLMVAASNSTLLGRTNYQQSRMSKTQAVCQATILRPWEDPIPLADLILVYGVIRG